MSDGTAHLVMPDADARTFGTLRRVRKDDGTESWVIEAEPAVLVLAKRVFPGADGHRGGVVRFGGTRRQVEDLLWLMMRFPLAMSGPDRAALLEAREGAAAVARGRVGRRERSASPGAVFTGELRPFQETGVGFLLDNHRAILADDMGLGKTVQAIAAMTALDRWPVVCVVPNSVTVQWSAMLEAFLGPRLGGWATLLSGTKPARHLPETPVYIIHYGLVRHWQDRLLALGPRAVVFDECQELRRGESKKYSACSRLSEAADVVWGLSGTPIYNYGDEIWWVLNAIDHYCLGGLEGFSREWCAGYRSRIVQNPEELGDYLKREGLLLRRRKSEVLDQLPPKRRVVQRVGHDGDVFSRLIGKAVGLARGYSEIADSLERGRVSRLIETEVRKATGVAKAPYAAAFVLSLIEAGERVVVFCHHHDVHDEIVAALERHGDTNPQRISGRETVAQKTEAVRAFASGESKAAVVALRTAAGIDGLQRNGTVVVFAELDWSPAIHSQCEDRLNRMGMDESMDSTLCYYLVADAGSDATMMSALGLKVGQFVGLMGDKGESEEDRDVAMRQAERHMESIIQTLSKIREAAA